MEMCYDGALVMPSSYAVMNEEEMTYVEGGATAKVGVKFTITANTLKAVGAAGVGVITGLITTAVCAALGVTGVGAVAIPAVVGFATSMIMSYVNDTKYKNMKNKTFSGTVSCWSPVKFSKNINLGTIGW